MLIVQAYDYHGSNTAQAGTAEMYWSYIEVHSGLDAKTL